jgi:hypothetical protein
MADFPTAKTEAVDNITDVLAKHLNNLEDKVGINSSADANSLDYKVTNTSSTNPGHKHSGDSVGLTTSTTTNLTGLLGGDGSNIEQVTKPTGDMVGTTDTQTLTNKTIDADDNTFSGMLDWFYPVGTIYETTSTDLDTTTKMGNHFGGTWEAYGSGRVLVAKSADTEFDTIGETGGAKTHTLTTAEMPSHTHKLSVGEGGNWNDFLTGNDAYAYGINEAYDSEETTYSTNETVGSGDAHNNLQPYIVVYRYRRTA